MCPNRDHIDHYSPTPLYIQLADMLRAQTESGELPPGRPLPSQRQGSGVFLTCTVLCGR